jgi:hypothetical protein
MLGRDRPLEKGLEQREILYRTFTLRGMARRLLFVELA